MRRTCVAVATSCLLGASSLARAQADLIFLDGFQSTPNTCGEAAARNSTLGCEFWAADLDNAVEVIGVQGSLECVFTPGVTSASVLVCADAGGTAVAGLCDPPAGACPGGYTCRTTAVCLLDAQASPFALLVSNPQARSVAVTVEAAGGATFTQDVPAGQSAALLPQANGIADQSLDGTGTQARAYRVTSDFPVALHQLNGAAVPAAFSAGASVLIPRHAFGPEYYAMTWPSLDRRPSFHSYHGYLSVVAPQDGTSVEVTPTSAVRASASQAGLPAGAAAAFSLDAHDVLTLQAVPGGDLTGSLVRCPGVACGVFVGHEAAGFGEAIAPDASHTLGPCCADHLEEMLFPASSWGKTFAVARSAPRGTNERDVLRVLARTLNTVVTFDPPAIGSCPALNSGQHCEVTIAADTLVVASEPVLVGQYLQSAIWSDPLFGGAVGTGDPELALVAPVEQHRREHSVRVPAGYSSHFLALAAPVGVDVRVDGVPVSLSPFAGGGYQAARVPVTAGAHQVSCAAGCNVVAHGYRDGSAYMFAAGLGLAAPRTGGVVDVAHAGGSLAGWSFASVDAGDLTADPAAAMGGTSWGMRASVDDTRGLYVQDDTPEDEPRYRARFYVDPGQFDPGLALGHRRTRILVAFTASPSRRVAAVVLRRLDDEYGIMGRARQDDNSQADTGFFPITSGPHTVEIDLVPSSGPDANDGSFTLWIDGVAVSTLAGLDNGAGAVDFARLGALSVKQGASGVLRFDEFESRRETYIGPLP
jgi:hypothetical protein